MTILLIIGALFTFFVFLGLHQAEKKHPLPPQNKNLQDSVSVVIPCFNEQKNIRACIESTLRSVGIIDSSGNSINPKQNKKQFDFLKSNFEIIVIDDGSTDATPIILKELKEKYDAFLKVIEGKPLPKDKKWHHKNWACHQGSQVAHSDYLLFVDADLRMKKGAIGNAISAMKSSRSGLLSVAPEIALDHWAEKMVQPIMMQILALVFANNGATKKVFAAGPFMLFDKSVYQKVGGHKAVCAEVVEDVALGTLVQNSDSKTTFLRGFNLARLHMYDSFSELWEGWTKNIFIGLDHSLLKAGFIGAMILAFYFLIPLTLVLNLVQEPLLCSSLIIGYLLLNGKIRRKLFEILGVGKAWTYLGYIPGSLLLFCMIITSVIKTQFRIGWTWKRRVLS